MDLGAAREILDTAHDAVVSMDAAGAITYWNPAAETLFGISRGNAVGRVLADTVIPERYRDAHREGLRRFLKTGEGPLLRRRIELSALRHDASEFPIELTISAQADGDTWAFHAFIQDISERKVMEDDRMRRLVELETSLEGSEQRFEAILGVLAEAVTIRDRDDRIIYANRAALDRLGFSSVEELRLADPAAIMGDFFVEGEDGRPLGMADVPSVRIFRGEHPGPLLMHTIDRQGGEEQWVLLKATPLRNAAGEIEAAVTVIEDVTLAKRAELRATFLARASKILGSSLDYQRTLRNVANLAVPEIADWCAVDLVAEDGHRLQVVAAHTDPSKLELAERLRGYEPAQLDPEHGLGRVMATGRPELYAEIGDELLKLGAQSEEHLRLLQELGMRSVLLLPMSAGGRTLGVMTLVSAESGRRFDAGDMAFAQQIAGRAAVAVENSRLYSERTAIAETLQKSLLPDALPAVDGWDLAALYRPAAGGMTVGGDFYDVFAVGDAWIVLIGDVTGKGVEAATVTSLVRHSARIVAEDDPDPAGILRRLDSVLRGQASLSVCSALCLRLDGGQVTLSAAGHPLPLLVGEQHAAVVGRPGTLLGAFEDGNWGQETITVGAGETLLLYTDGITDTVGASDRFGDHRLLDVARDCAGQSADEMLAWLDERLNAYQVGTQADDTAALALRLVPIRDGPAGQAVGRRQSA